MSVIKPFERFARAYTAALAGRDPHTVSIRDLLPAIFATVPDTAIEEITAALLSNETHQYTAVTLMHAATWLSRPS